MNYQREPGEAETTKWNVFLTCGHNFPFEVRSDMGVREIVMIGNNLKCNTCGKISKVTKMVL